MNEYYNSLYSLYCPYFVKNVSLDRPAIWDKKRFEPESPGRQQSLLLSFDFQENMLCENYEI